MAEKTKDTLFIDMKYVILYRKLGYDEISQDVFRYDYADTSITIYSEEQRFVFCGESYGLINYKDFAILECIDRLLKKGYAAKNIKLCFCGYDIAILHDNDEIYIGIFAEAWGKNYEKLLDTYRKTSENTECLYTSQLSGGLVDF